MKRLLKVLRHALLILPALLLMVAVKILTLFRRRSESSPVSTDANPFITGRTQVSAHRSGGGIMPEETRMAFRNCVENPHFSVDLFEFDLHLTRDGVLVLQHDDVLDRTSDSASVFGKRCVRPEQKTYAELRSLNMGAKFVTDDGRRPYAHLSADAVPEDLRILSLENALDFLRVRGDYFYIIEIKNSGSTGCRAADRLYDVVASRGLLHRVLCGTFHGEVSAYIDRTYPDLMRGAYPAEVLKLYIAALLNKKDYAPACRAFQLPYGNFWESYGVNLGTGWLVDYAHAHGLAVQYWTVNRERDMKKLISLGADCIMSDYPDRLYRLREQMDPSSGLQSGSKCS